MTNSKQMLPATNLYSIVHEVRTLKILLNGGLERDVDRADGGGEKRGDELDGEV
jgi:hypothetical protein